MFNHALYRLKYRYAKYLPLKVPVDVSLELSSFCDLRCEFCYHNNQENLPFEKKFMPTDMAKSIIEQCAEIGVSSIKMNARGESTLNPNYQEILNYAGKFNFIDLLANSNFNFPEKRRNNILDGMSNLTKVKVSYDSFIKEVFEKQRIRSNFDLITSNVDAFYNLKNRKTEIVIQAVRTLLNKDEDIEAEAKKKWPNASVSVRDMVSGRIKKDLSEFENKKRDFTKRQACIQAFARLIFHSNGLVAPCCPSFKGDLIIGNINKQSVKEIFNSFAAKQLRDSLKSGEAFKTNKTCIGCSSFETFVPYKHPFNS